VSTSQEGKTNDPTWDIQQDLSAADLVDLVDRLNIKDDQVITVTEPVKCTFTLVWKPDILQKSKEDPALAESIRQDAKRHRLGEARPIVHR